MGFVILSSSSYATPTTPQENAGVHVLVTASEREVASPNKANADRLAANVLPVIEQIKGSGRHVIACDRQSAEKITLSPRRRGRAAAKVSPRFLATNRRGKGSRAMEHPSGIVDALSFVHPAHLCCASPRVAY